MRQWLLAAALLAPVGPAAAQNWTSLMKGGPLEVFNAEDNKFFVETLHRALERPADGQALGWVNPKTGHRGEITVLREFDSRGRACKEMQLRAEAQGRKGEQRLNFCSIEGEWKLLGDSQL